MTQPTNTPRSSGMSLFRLPRELRDLVYEFYFSEDGGYVQMDYQSNKLRMRNKKPIDLSLMFICKEIATEARGAPFRANTIEFQATYFQDYAITERAVRFDQVYHLRHDIRAWLVNRCRSCITNRVQSEVLYSFPSAETLLKYLLQAPPSDRNVVSSGQDWHVILFTFYECIAYLLQKMSDEPDFQEVAYEALLAWIADLTPPSAYLYKIVLPSTDVRPRDIPSEDELLTLERAVGIVDDGHQIHPYRRWFSAVSLSIRFLRSLPRILRQAVRHIP